MEVVLIMETEVQTTFKSMKKGGVPGIDEVCGEMLSVVGEMRGWQICI